MGGKQKKKGTSGTATSFVSRGKSIKRLQLTLKDFRRLCILKGIYPVEPKNKTKAGGGNKTYYLAKDIRFLAHEPIINKFREIKIFMKKLRRAIDKRNSERESALRNNEPVYRLDHIVKERYPTFIDAVRDLDDALSMCFLFSTLPKSGLFKTEILQMCRKLSVEFMNYVIESRSLQKVFISIKGFYYQANILGQPVTWVVAHSFPQSSEDIDARIMATFTDFYVTLLGFINFKLYNSINLVYPPKLAVDSISQRDAELCEGEDAAYEHLQSLATSLKSVVKDNAYEDAEIDNFDDVDGLGMKQSAEAESNFRNLFKGLRVFLNREVPRESFTFVLRSFGAQVSWDSYTFPGATFEEKDEAITHQIVDRPVLGERVLNRYYIQPQWVFDCVNARRILPVEDYFPGVELPAHLSPFVDASDGGYTPLSKQQIQKRLEEEENMDEDVEEVVENKQVVAKVKGDMKVKLGKITKEDKVVESVRQSKEEKKLAVMMIPKREKRLYDKILKSKKIQKKAVDKLVEKREKNIRVKKEHKAR